MFSVTRKYLFFIQFSIIISFFLTLLTGCTFFPNESPLVINKYEEDGNSSYYKTINNDKSIKAVQKVLNNAKWENSKVELERKPDYAFYFENPNAKAVEFRLWITPNKKQVEISEGTGEFAKLSKEDTKIIFSIFEIK